MDINTQLQDLKKVCQNTLNKANAILAEKGGEEANTIDDALNKIQTLPSGDDSLLRIALEAIKDEELGTVDLKLDSTWGDLIPYAFCGNTKLKSADFSECVNMTKIPSYCFNGCENLTSIKFPPFIKTLGTNSIKTTGISDLVIPATIETLGSHREAQNLKTVTFEPDGALKAISGDAFRSCWNLTKIDFGTTSKVGSIGVYAFADTRALKEIWLPPCLKTLSYGIFGAANGAKVYFRSTPTTWSTNGGFNASYKYDIYVPWSEGEVAGAPWGAEKGTIHYDWKTFEHIEITTPPDTVGYAEGEIFDATGMVVTAYDSSGTPTVIDDYFYSQEPLQASVEKQPFYIYAYINGNKHITYTDINVGVV